MWETSDIAGNVALYIVVRDGYPANQETQEQINNDPENPATHKLAKLSADSGDTTMEPSTHLDFTMADGIHQRSWRFQEMSPIQALSKAGAHSRTACRSSQQVAIPFLGAGNAISRVRASESRFRLSGFCNSTLKLSSNSISVF